MRRASHNRQRGFSLVELGVVVLIAVLLAATALFVTSSIAGSGTEAAVSLISAGVSSTRLAAIGGAGTTVGVYQGAALMFMPNNEVVVVRHDPTMTDDVNAPLGEAAQPKAGYREYGNIRFKLFDSVGVVGIQRVSEVNGQAPRLLAPPFAIRFDAGGCLVNRRTATPLGDGYVYYDGYANASPTNHTAQTNWNPVSPPWPAVPVNRGWVDGRVFATRTRPTTYNPFPWDPRNFGNPIGLAVNLDSNAAPGHYGWRLPFDQIDTVIGVVVFDRKQLNNVASSMGRTPETVLAATTNGEITNDRNTLAINTPAEWILTYGKVLFFNRYSGRVQREARP
jgi:Tfp pilus assembly major pilin PilA